MAKARILIIEDNRDNRELVRFLLEQAKYEVLQAVTGSEGWQIAQQEHPDLILLDLTIPEIDGWQLAEMLKNDPKLADIPVVALTAHTLPVDRKRAMDAGCVGYLTKPLDIPNFIPQIQAYLAGKHLAATDKSGIRE